jgi:hypothetical protein
MTGNDFRAWRARRKLTLEQVGLILGVQYTTVARWSTLGDTPIPIYWSLVLRELDHPGHIARVLGRRIAIAKSHREEKNV